MLWSSVHYFNVISDDEENRDEIFKMHKKYFNYSQIKLNKTKMLWHKSVCKALFFTLLHAN